MKTRIVLLALTLFLTGLSEAGSKKDIDAPAYDKALAQQMIGNSIQRFQLADDVLDLFEEADIGLPEGGVVLIGNHDRRGPGRCCAAQELQDGRDLLGAVRRPRTER